jgi:hypothetical protein
MKKVLSVLAIILMIQLSGCQKSEFYTILDKINFNQDLGVYCIDSSKDNDSLILFAIGDNVSKEDLEFLDNLNMKVTLVSNDNKKEIIESNNAKWEVCDPNFLKNGLSLRLTLKINMSLNDMVINKIMFTSNKNAFKIDINPIYISTITSIDNGITIMEAPVAPKHNTEVGKQYSYAYKILDQSGNITNDLRASILYNENLNKYIEISNIEIIPDENMENQIKTDYKNKVSKEKLSKIKIYEIRCYYIIHKKSNIVFQPRILLQYSDKKQDLIPFEPICFFMN